MTLPASVILVIALILTVPDAISEDGAEDGGPRRFQRFAERMNRSTKRFPLYEKNSRGAYGIRTTLDMITHSRAREGPCIPS